jgi:integrase
MPSITIRSVQALGPGQTLWDTTVRGFGVRRQQDTAAYVVKYRVAGRQRFVTIGRHGPWTPERARKEAKRLLGAAATGRDPSVERAEARRRAADTVGKVAEDYLAYARRTLRKRTYAETERYLLRSWAPLHAMSVFDVRRRDVAAQLAAIEARNGPSSAAWARAALSAMFNWAIREGIDLPGNPVAGTNRPAEPPSRERVLTDAELGAIWAACRDDVYGRIVKLLALTAQRRGEVAGMRWAEIDLDGAVWRLPKVRTKNEREHVVPLSGPAVAILQDQAMAANASSAADGLVFGRGFTNWSKAKAALDSSIPVLPWRLHDLRRTAATVMADRLGVLPHIVEAILNHVGEHRRGVAGIYNRARYEADMRAALDRWAAHLAALVN